MFQRPSAVRFKAANDNFILDPRIVVARRALRMSPLPPPVYSASAHLGRRPLLVLGLAALVLVALSSAFLLGLAAVGLLASVICSIELFRRRILRLARPSLALIGRRAVGCW